jgi:hypothetical protein
VASTEFEMDGEATRADHAAADPARHNAPRYDAFASSDLPTEELLEDFPDDLLDGPESGADAPILLVRPLEPTPTGRRR